MRPCFRFGGALSIPAVALVLCFVAGAAGAEGDAGTDPLAEGLSPRERLNALVERVKDAQSGARTMTAAFVQHRESELLLEAEESQGEFFYRAPDRVLWRYSAPHPKTTLIRGEEMLTYYPELNEARRAAIGSISDRVFEYLGVGSLETLMKHFSVTADFPESADEPYHLVLDPRYERLKKRIASMEIWIDGRRFLPQRLRYAEADGDVTEYRFEGLEINVELPDETFELTLPDGVHVKTTDLRKRR